MDNLRWMLLAIGVVIIAGVYLYGRFDLGERLAAGRARRQRHRAPEPQPYARREPAHLDETMHALTAPDEREIEFSIPGFDDDLHDLAQDEPELHTGFEPALEATSWSPAEATSAPLAAPDEPPQPAASRADTPRKTQAAERVADRKILSGDAEPLVLVLSILANTPQRFAGPALQAALEHNGLRFGDMQIYHYFHHGEHPALFSVANAVEPGTFDAEAMQEFSTPGLTLFCQLPGVLPPAEAFDSMLSHARAIAAQLNGRLCDERRNPLTSQAINHYRDRIAAYNHKRMLAGRG